MVRCFCGLFGTDIMLNTISITQQTYMYITLWVFQWGT